MGGNNGLSDITIDGTLLKKMITEGANSLEENKSLVDSLNVFPVPDGDTGTNMSLTTLAAAREACKIDTNKACDVAKAAASGSLRGARGNSGVIASQLFRGFAKSLEGKDTINCRDIADALTKASETAYKAVMKPKEGTILTVAKVIAEKACDMVHSTEDFNEFACGVMEAGNDILKKTTNMLPQLKEAGVVDAGGKGLLIFLDGAVRGAYLQGEANIIASFGKQAEKTADFSNLSADDIKFAYCTEFFINLVSAGQLEQAEGDLKAYLENNGDSIVVVGDDDIIKVHIHTNRPGAILEKAMEFGYLSSMKIENMKLQHTSLLGEQDFAPPKEVGIVAAAIGRGMTNLFKELGADAVVEGGQSMNPSTNDFLEAINEINAKNIIVLPNNKNVILAASQAAELAEGKNVCPISSRTMPEGLAAMLNYVSVLPAAEIISNMKTAINTVKTGEITSAVRSAAIDGKKIKKGDIICMMGGKIEIVTKNLEAGALELFTKMTEDGASEIVTVYYGADVTENDAMRLKDKLTAKNPDIEIEIYNGGQPLYYYILSAE